MVYQCGSIPSVYNNRVKGASGQAGAIAKVYIRVSSYDKIVMKEYGEIHMVTHSENWIVWLIFRLYRKKRKHSTVTITGGPVSS